MEMLLNLKEKRWTKKTEPIITNLIDNNSDDDVMDINIDVDAEENLEQEKLEGENTKKIFSK